MQEKKYDAKLQRGTDNRKYPPNRWYMEVRVTGAAQNNLTEENVVIIRNHILTHREPRGHIHPVPVHVFGDGWDCISVIHILDLDSH
jgi:hypothetical protein